MSSLAATASTSAISSASASASSSADAGTTGPYSSAGVIGCAVLFLVLCTLFVALRFVAIRFEGRPVFSDDWILLPAWALIMGLCANIMVDVKYGGLGTASFSGPATLATFEKILFATELIYGPLIALEKSSLLLLYLRLFSVRRWFRRATWAALAYIWLWALGELLTAVFQCRPVSFQWDKTLPGGGACINLLLFYRWVGVPNVAHDVAMLFLPMPVVWKLKLTTRKKIGLSSVFLIGSMGCVVSFVRLSLFLHPGAFSGDPRTTVQLVQYTLAEPGVILICACMPGLWSLVPRLATCICGTRRRRRDTQVVAPATSAPSRYTGSGSRVSKSGAGGYSYGADDVDVDAWAAPSRQGTTTSITGGDRATPAFGDDEEATEVGGGGPRYPPPTALARGRSPVNVLITSHISVRTTIHEEKGAEEGFGWLRY